MLASVLYRVRQLLVVTWVGCGKLVPVKYFDGCLCVYCYCGTARVDGVAFATWECTISGPYRSCSRRWGGGGEVLVQAARRLSCARRATNFRV